MMQSLSRDYEEEPILFSEAAKMLQNEVFNNETNFFGNLDEYDSRHNLPLASNLMSMVLYVKK